MFTPDAVTQAWIKTAADERAAYQEGCTFQPARAELVRRFFHGFLRHSKGREWAGKPFELLPWQWGELIQPLFGWVKPNGLRRFSTAYVELPKKSGKSEIAAGIGLYMLCGDGEPGAQCYSTGSTRDQASLVHLEAIKMVQASPDLSKVLRIHGSTKRISYPKKNSFYAVLSSEAAGQEGLDASALICDEVHVWHGRGLWDTLRYACIARKQPLRFLITTAGDDPLSVCREQHDYATAILKGDVLDTSYFPLIKAADPGDDWTDPAVWRKANPSLGVITREEDFARDVEEAKRTPTAQASFKRYRLNIWSSMGNQWLRPEDWAACRGEYTEQDLEGQTCFAGLDLALTRDMTALVLVFPGEPVRILPYFWLPEGTVNDPGKPEQFRVWAKEGFIDLTPGDVCDYSFIKRRLTELSGRFLIQELIYDRKFAEQLTQEVERDLGIKREDFPQTAANYNEPCRDFERLLLDRKFLHNGHPVMNWQAGHVAVYTTSFGEIRPVKPRNEDARKIDGIVAFLMGFAKGRLFSGEATPTVTWI